jgi:RNA polymerase-binding transcription factor DksA
MHPSQSALEFDHTAIQGELIERRRHLEAAAARSNTDHLSELLDAVDSALERMEDGSYGICEVCDGAMGHDRLTTDPLARVCLECLTPTEQRALEYDLELASSIQTGLLPNRHFENAGWEGHYHYEPKGAVSGDFCDVVPAEGSTFVLLGDVSGKGVAAALLMSHLSAIFRGLVGSGLTLVEIMGHANRMFSPAIPVRTRPWSRHGCGPTAGSRSRTPATYRPSTTTVASTSYRPTGCRSGCSSSPPTPPSCCT